MKLGEKIKILRLNSGLKQKELAEKLCCSEDTVSKWENGINTPPIDRLIDLSSMFEVSIDDLTKDESVAIKEYEYIETLTPNDLLRIPSKESEHEVLNAGLKRNANLHRFENPAGIKYSAIYIGLREYFSCERDQESKMIKYWNSMSI